MAAHRPDQARTGAAGAMIGTPEAQVTPARAGTRSTPAVRPSRSGPGTCSGSRRFAAASAIRAGTIDVAEPLADSSVYVQIDPASFRTGNGQRDSNVRSEGLLDADRYPVITFRSEGMDGLDPHRAH